MFPLLLANVDFGPYSQAARFGLFLLATFVLLAGSWLLVRRVRDYELVLLGLLVAAAATGYGLMSSWVPDPNMATPVAAPGFVLGTGSLAGTLMKIAVVLVLAGVARSLLVACSNESPVDSPRP